MTYFFVLIFFHFPELFVFLRFLFVRNWLLLEKNMQEGETNSIFQIRIENYNWKTFLSSHPYQRAGNAEKSMAGKNAENTQKLKHTEKPEYQMQ